MIRGKRAHRGTVGLTPGNYSGMGALLRAHVRKIYILSQLVKNLGESVRGGVKGEGNSRQRQIKI